MPRKKQTTDDKPRWLYRFKNYQRAYKLLNEAIELAGERALSSLEEEGVIQRFEYTWELAWNLLADLLIADGVALDRRTPLVVVRAAHEASLITDGDDWMDALDARNRMAHTYDEAEFEKVIEEIQATYLRLFESLYKAALARKASQ